MNKLGLAACLLASACIRNGDDGTFSNSESVAAGDALGASVESSASTFGPLDQNAAVDGATCVTLTGDLTDTDGDNIPVSATLTYACTETFLGLTGNLSGTLAVTDDDPNAAAWKFTGTAALHASLTNLAGASIVTDRDGTLTATQAGLVGPFALDHDLDVVTVFTGARDNNPATLTVTEAAAWTLTFTPMVTWTPGGLIVSGNLAADGAWTVTVGSAVAAATLSTPTPLTLTPTCETRITAGSVAASYVDSTGIDRVITVTWTACGVHTVAST